MVSKAKNLFAVVAALSSVILSLSGCGSSVADGSNGQIKKSNGDVNITINWWGSDTRVKNTEKVIKAFEKLHPNIHVDPQYSDWSGYKDKLSTQVAGGNSPDVMQMDELFLSSYATQGSLLNLKKASDFLKLNELDKNATETANIGGKQFAAPTGVAPMGVAVNIDLINKLGVKLPEDAESWNWSEFEDFEKNIVTKSEGKVTGAGVLPSGDGLTLLARQNGEYVFKNGKVSIKENTLENWFRKTYEYTHDGIMGTPDEWAEDLTATTEQTAFSLGKQAAKFMTAIQVSAYANVLGTQNIKLLPLPSDSKQKYMYMKPTMYWAISSATKHPAEAAMLVDYLINNRSAVQVQGTDRGIPANLSVRSSLAKQATGLDKLAYDFTQKESKNLSADVPPEVTPNGAGDFQNIGKRYQQDVVFGKQSPQNAAKKMIEELNGDIESAQ